MVPECREHHQEEYTDQRDHQLFLRFLVVDPRDDHQSDAQQHEDVVDHQHVRALVQGPVDERSPHSDKDLQQSEYEIVLDRKSVV